MGGGVASVTVIVSTQTFSKSRRAVTARQRRVIELAALGTPIAEIAKQMGSVRVDTIQDLLDRALANQAEELRSEGAWERAYALHIARLDALMAAWMPKALAGDDKAADKVDKWLTHLERVGGLAAPQRLEAAVVVEDGADTRANVIAAVLARLDDVKIRQQIIDGDVIADEAEESAS